MANPRKFSEKIALHNQKQAEETAEFLKVMQEVSDATKKGSGCKRQQLHINQSLGSFRGGSLPNVNKVMMATQTELKSTLSCMDNLKNVQGSNPSYRERPRSAVGPMRSRPAEKRIDTSPYSGVYLSPPPDTTWRRTHSDSALHRSSHESNNHSYRKGLESYANAMSIDYDNGRRLSSASPDGRQRSDADMPRVPGIREISSPLSPSFHRTPLLTTPSVGYRLNSPSNVVSSFNAKKKRIFPSQQDPGATQIPIGNNTGSLPDLTSFHIPSPLNIPLDREEQTHSLSGAYCTSPRSLSPSPHLHTGRYSYVGTPPNEAPRPTSPHMNHHSNQLSVPSYDSHKLLQSNTDNHRDSFGATYLPSMTPLHQTSVQSPVYGNTSPCGSSPQSPASPASIGCSINSSTDHNNYLIGPNALHHRFEQFTMMDSPSELNIDYVGSTNSTSILQDDSTLRNHELTPDPGYFSTSPSQNNPYNRLAQETTSPNTPSSIPDIVLTDFSNSEEMVRSLESEFPSDEYLGEGLTPLDIDGIQMLTYPDIIADPAVEDRLRLDRLEEWVER